MDNRYAEDSAFKQEVGISNSSLLENLHILTTVVRLFWCQHLCLTFVIISTKTWDHLQSPAVL